MAANRSFNSNRQRNLSVTSNTSTSSYKDNASNNQKASESQLPTVSRVSNGRSRNGISVKTASLPSTRSSTVTSSTRDFPSLRADYDTSQNLSSSFEISESERELEDKLNEIQHKKWQYENIMFQLQQLQSSFQGSFHIPRETVRSERQPETSNNETTYIPLVERSAKLREAQQQLSHLQELMHNVSLDLDYNTGSIHNNNKNVKINSPQIKECPDFLRNVTPKAGTKSRVNPRLQQSNGVFYAPHPPSQQNNLSFNLSSLPTRHSAQRNSSLFDVFAQSEDPSINSSNEGSAGEIEDNNVEVDEEETIDDSHPRDQTLQVEPLERNGFPLPQDRLDRLEQQIDRMNSLCEAVATEQRRLVYMVENLHCIVAASQPPSNPSSRRRLSNLNLPFISLSSLPMNSSWNDNAVDVQLLAQAVSQCCQLLSQLQRDLAGMHQTLESHGQVTSASNPLISRANEVHFNPFREAKPRPPVSLSSSSYDCNSDRIEPGITLNNRVAPGTRTNNYWDNFRSYSRQNLLSSAPTKVARQGLDRESVHRFGTLVPTRPETEPCRSDGSRGTKRKVNKGQRQIEIGVHSPHADNRALAYGLLSVGGSTGLEVNSATGRNLNPQIENGNDVETAATSDSSSNKVIKDTANLKYSGARPKENRRSADPPSQNVNLLTEQEIQTSAPKQGLEQPVQSSLGDHAENPQFLAQLMDILHKLDSDRLRQMALNALQSVARNREPNLLKLFDAVVNNQREFTPHLLDEFLAAIQQPEEEQDSLEGAAALPLSNNEQIHYIRHSLTPFLFRRMSEVHCQIRDTLSKIDSNPVGIMQPSPNTSETAVMSSRADDLAEADQSCDGIVESIGDNSPSSAMQDWNEDDIENRHVATGLDEVPTRLMSVLTPPSWTRSMSSSHTSPTPDDLARNNARPRTEPESNAWFPEDDGV